MSSPAHRAPRASWRRSIRCSSGSGEDPAEQLALAKLACAVGEQDLVGICAELEPLIDAAAEAFPQPEELRYHVGARLIVFAIAVARTPAAPLPVRG